MNLNEIKKDIGVHYDRLAVESELRDIYDDVDVDIIHKVLRQKIESKKEIDSLVSLLKTTYSMSSATQRSSQNGLLNLLSMVYKDEITYLSNIRREKKHMAETSTAGGTSAGGIAGAVQPLGGSMIKRGIYGNFPKKSKKIQKKVKKDK